MEREQNVLGDGVIGDRVVRGKVVVAGGVVAVMGGVWCIGSRRVRS